MGKVECAKKMKAVLQQMGLWPVDVNVLDPNIDPRRKHILFSSSNTPDQNMVDTTKKMQFFEALAAQDVFPSDMHKYTLADISSIREGETLRETPVIVRLLEIEKALQPEQGRGATPGF